MTPKLRNFLYRTLTYFVGGVIFFGAWFLGTASFLCMLFFIFGYVLLVEWPPLIARWRAAGILFSVFYPFMPMMMLSWIIYTTQCSIISLWPFLIAWSYDTGAYLAGSLIGRHKICPQLSPGKSWEGLMGGLCTTAICLLLLMPESSWYLLLVRAAGYTALAFFGDLFISWLKRKAQLKDTGAILPGHGGLLDRGDSVLFVAPAVLIEILIQTR